MLPEAAVNNGLGRHVHAHGKGLCGKEHLDPSLGKEDLHDLVDMGGNGRRRQGGLGSAMIARYSIFRKKANIPL
jgi:hypothetical protein